ncbi:cation/H(+) antiporter 15-like [Pistacia vera]|uniref:cation/H(+) antiporter 15-like n=1 Tax=Pistacia vera TaxID=55513 RepID=UPI001263D003|nr:cation/H(+) antiporter 15-like [Pistacia vera]
MATFINVSSSNEFSFLLDRDFKTCVLEKKDVIYKGGIPFAERHSSTNVFPIFMIQVIFFFLTSQFFYFILRPLKQPKTVCNLLSGMILGPSVLGRNKKLWDKLFPAKEMVLINSTSLFGVIYLFFLLAVKIDTVMTINMAKSIWKLSLIVLMIPFIITMTLTGLLIRYIPGLTPGPFIYFFSMLLSSSYFTSTANAVGDLDLPTSDLGRLALACSIFHELIGWGNMALGIMISGGSKSAVIKAEISMFALLLFVFFIVRPAVKMIIRRTPEEKPVKTEYIIGILILTVVVSIVSDHIGSSFVAGALLMGLVIPAGPPLGSALVEKSDVIISNIFMPFLYIRIGQNINIPTITDWSQFFAIETIMIMIYISKIAASILAFIFFKKNVRSSILFGFILNFKGIPDFVLISGWNVRKLVDEQVVTTILLSHMLISAIATPIIEIYYKPERRLITTDSIGQRMMKPLQGMPLEMELRILFCINNEDNVNSLITLFKAWNPIETTPFCAYPVHLMELTGRAVPLLIPYNNHKFKLNSNSTDRIMRSLTKFTKKSGFSITIQPFTMIAPYKNMHESICNLVRDKYIPLVIIPFHKSLQENTKTTIFRKLNTKIQTYAPCTVGIFIDRGLHDHHLSSRPFFYNVVVFFLGGPDDREAMAFVSRMNSQPGLVITVFLIDFKGDYLVENEFETDLDNSIIKEFRARSIKNPCVVFQEVVAYDSVQVMGAIHSIEDKYDLVIVGKRRIAKSILDKELVRWVEQKELGVIGDVVASSDFYGGMTSVLVIQSCVTNGENVESTIFTSSEGTSDFSTCSGDDSYGGSFHTQPERDQLRLCTKV